jgi:hypothetical protein
MAFLFKFLIRLQQVQMLFLIISARFIRINHSIAGEAMLYAPRAVPSRRSAGILL